MKAFMLLFLLAFFSVSFGQQVYNSCLENEGADISVTLPTSFNTANAKLPDPFKKIDGTRISAKDDWKTRRQEILNLAERTIYGTKAPKPTNVSGTVSNTSITVNVGNSKFTVTVSLPSNGTKPYPAVIRYGNSGADESVIKALGVAVINYTPTDVGGETGSARTKSGVFYTVNSGSPYNKTGTLAAWAWGVSRIIDVIEADPNKLLDPMRIGVTGCSRYGKGPFAAGALDQRIALTMPMEGGTGGAAIMRGAAKESGAQSPSNAYGEQPWLGDDFSTFQNSLNNLPIDMHEVVGLIAPRGLLILEKPSAADWLASRSGHMSALAGSKVYEALGYGGNITYHSNNTNGSHCAWITEWKTPVEDNIKRFLLRTQAPPTAPIMNPRSDRQFATADWIDWTAPTLSGSLTIETCAASPSSSSQGETSSSSSSPSSSSAPPPSSGNENCAYQSSWCGGKQFATNSSTKPVTGECVFVKDYTALTVSSGGGTILINGETCTTNCVTAKPSAKDGGYYIYVQAGAISNSQPYTVTPGNPECEVTPIARPAPLTTSHTLSYYSLKGEPLGNAKPQKAGVYIVKQDYSVKKIVVK